MIDMPTQSATDDRSITLTRVFDAPRVLVWRAWTDPERLVRWWGPRGFTNTFQETDVRPGGVRRFVMHGPDGRDYPNLITYREVVEPERLAYSHGRDDDHASDFEVEVTFAEEGARTRVTMRSTFPSAEARDHVVRAYGAVERGNETLDKLGEELARMQSEGASGREFVLSREFDAPRELVWKAWTDPERLARWWGPKDFKNEVRALDLRPGGVFHYSMMTPNGEMWGRFVYREITPPERLVFVTSFSDEQAGITRAPFSENWPLEVHSTVTFDERGGKTFLTLRSEPINANDAERAQFESWFGSMQQGWGGTLDQLEGHLAAA